jgi:repressor LexA
MKLHATQEKLLKIAGQINLNKMSLRDVGALVEETHPQKIRHHLDQLVKKGFIKIDHKTGEVMPISVRSKSETSDVVAVPIYGSADCGEAKIFASENLDGYLRVSRSLIGKVKNIFAIRAQGPSMNRAKINGRHSVKEGDYVLIDPNNKSPENGDYVLSIIDGCANIKKFLFNKKENQIALMSESSEKIPPIYIHSDDDYMINGIVKNVIKNSSFKELSRTQSASAADILKNLGPISKKEVNYYENL